MPHPCTIQLISPAGWPEPQALERGVARLRAAGCVVAGEETAARRYQRFAGTDAERAADINRLADPRVPLPDIVMAVRGGCGVHRILDRLDYEGVAERLRGAPCALVGHSDLTALHLALLAKAGLITFAGPMLARDFGGEAVSGFTLAAFRDTLASPSHTTRWQARGAKPVQASGILWGGNLSVLVGLLGTPYLPAIDGGILFIEDTHEPVYRVDRLLGQLHLAGILGRQSAVLVGDFTDCVPDHYDPSYDLSAVLDHVRARSGVPIVTQLPFGHRDDKLTLPVGAPARLHVDATGLAQLSFEGYPCVPRCPVVAGS